jgi:hypothetical protein
MPTRFYRGDLVTTPHYDGVWKIAIKAPGAGEVWLEPWNDIARAVALWAEYGMLKVHSATLSAYQNEG